MHVVEPWSLVMMMLLSGCGLNSELIMAVSEQVSLTSSVLVHSLMVDTGSGTMAVFMCCVTKLVHAASELRSALTGSLPPDCIAFGGTHQGPALIVQQSIATQLLLTTPVKVQLKQYSVQNAFDTSVRQRLNGPILMPQSATVRSLTGLVQPTCSSRTHLQQVMVL